MRDMITRRNLLGFVPALIAAPAIIRVADLMPVKVWEPPPLNPYWIVTAHNYGPTDITMEDPLSGAKVYIAAESTHHFPTGLTWYGPLPQAHNLVVQATNGHNSIHMAYDGCANQLMKLS